MANYQDFIRDAFISPIRSVLIIDDDYPTFDEVLGKQEEGKKGKKDWHNNPDQIRNVIQSFRSKNRSYLVDIHDGKNLSPKAELEKVSHLHQSDLLVLDFALDKSKVDDGQLAINILQKIMQNLHFNLVIVHTNTDIEKAFFDVLTGMIGRHERVQTEADRLIAEQILRDKDIDIEGFYASLKSEIGASQYFHTMRNRRNYSAALARGNAPYALFKQRCDAAELDPAARKRILDYFVDEYGTEQSPQMNADMPSEINWCPDKRWIRTESVFVAFSPKPDQADLMDVLLSTLVNWKPEPSRLFLTKLRAAMDEFGVAAQSQVLNNNLALAYWYKGLLEAKGDGLLPLIEESISRHSKELLGYISSDVEKFALEMVKSDRDGRPSSEVCKEHYSVDLEDRKTLEEATKEHNAFVSSHIKLGRHLFTGDVFIHRDEHWVCLTPACDMIPEQMNAGDKRDFGGRLPFVALKLHHVPAKYTFHASEHQYDSSEVQSGCYVFLKQEGGVKVLKYNLIDHPSSSPQWKLFFADKAAFSKRIASNLKSPK